MNLTGALQDCLRCLLSSLLTILWLVRLGRESDEAGSEGVSKQVEAVEIKSVPKGQGEVVM